MNEPFAVITDKPKACFQGWRDYGKRGGGNEVAARPHETENDIVVFYE